MIISSGEESIGYAHKTELRFEKRSNENIVDSKYYVFSKTPNVHK